MHKTRTSLSSISTAIVACDKPSFVSIQKNEPNEYEGFRIEVANSTSKLMDAANLAYRGYLKKGFVSQSTSPFVFNEWDFSGISACLVAYDKYNNCVGTMTIVPDKEKLPMDIIFEKELTTLRQEGHKLCEFSRFIIDDEFKNQKELLTALMEWSYLIANFYFYTSDIIVEVNPRHQLFYTKKLLFVAQSNPKSCPLVNNAPAVLMRLPIQVCEEKIHMQKIKRLLYADFKSRNSDTFDQMKKYLTIECNNITPQTSLSSYFKSSNEVKVS